MIGNPIEKRRAERYAELLEAAQGGRRRHRRNVHDEELAPLMEVGEALRETAAQTRDAAAATPEFQAALRQRLLAVAATQGIGATARDAKPSESRARDSKHSGRSTTGGRRMVIASALALGVLGLSGVSTASGDAVPGDTLYPVKRSAERAQLALAGSEVNRGQLFFEFASTRLDEAGQVIDDREALNTTLSDMDSQLAKGMKSLTAAAVNRQDAAVLDTIDAFLDGQSPKLAQLLDEAPGSNHESVGESMDLMDSAAERSQELREALLCSASFDNGDADRLGPMPGECGVLPGSDGTPLDLPSGESAPSEDGTESGGTGTGESESDDSSTPSPQPEKPSGQSPPPPTAPPSSPEGNDGGLLGEIGDTLDDLLG